ncbi:MAG: cell division ATP-binding protein FtsE [Clostridiales bacterium]|nr:cell division ATP-binding protein FtsE [Clostridiales bacterium]
MIEFRHVTKAYNDNDALHDVSVKINKGDFVFLVGPSGAGKSTFIKLILKEIDPDAGSIRVKGEEVTTMSNRKIPRHRRNIGIVFQDFRLLPHKTVYENVAFAMEITHQSKRAIKRNVPQALALMGISEYASKYPSELSAGEQQRVAIARAIVNKPTVLIADEPTGNLDPVTAWEIMKLLEEINARGTTIVMVTHAKDIVDRMQKRVIVIENGRVVRDEFGKYGLGGFRQAKEDSTDPEDFSEEIPEAQAFMEEEYEKDADESYFSDRRTTEILKKDVTESTEEKDPDEAFIDDAFEKAERLLARHE